MALANKAFSIDITPGAIPPVVHVSEYDTNRQYTVTLMNDGETFTIPSGTTAKVEGTLAGHGFTANATVSGNTVIFTLTEGMTAYAGNAWTKIKLTNSNKPVSTCAFILAVDRAGVEASTIINDSGFEEQIRNAVGDYIDEHGIPSDVVLVYCNPNTLACTYSPNKDGTYVAVTGYTLQTLLGTQEKHVFVMESYTFNIYEPRKLAENGSNGGDISFQRFDGEKLYILTIPGNSSTAVKTERNVQTEIETDDTLSVPGAAADAAAVGAQLNSFGGSGTVEVEPSGSLDLFIKQSDTTLRLGTPDDCRTAYFPCIPFTKYTVKKTVSSAAFSVGWTTVMPASGVLVNGFLKDLSATSFEVTTGEGAAYIVVYYAYNEASPETVYNSVRLVVPNSITLKQKIASMEQRIDDLDDEVADSLGDYFTTVTETIQTDPSGGGSSGGGSSGGTSTSINLLNPNDPDIEADKTVDISGSIVTASGKSISGYIPVSGGGVWYSYHYPQGETHPGFLLYNSAKQYVDYWVPVEGNSRIHFATDGNGHKYLAFKLSDGSSVRYVRVSTDTSALGVYAMFVQAETMPNTYVPYSGGGGGGGDEPSEPTIVTVTRNALKGDVSDLGGKRIRLTMERGTFASGGKPSSAFSPLPSERCRTAYYIKTNGATSFSLLDLGRYVHGSIYLEYYNVNMTFISESSALTSPLNITIPSTAAYLKFVVVSSERIRTLDAVFYGGIYAPEQVKNKAIWGSSASEQILFDIKDDTYGCARLALPSIYSVDGVPVPLIVYAHGSGMMNSWNQEMTRFSTNKYFCDEGFAILEIFGWDNEDWTTYGTGTAGVDPYPIPYWLRMYEHAVEHVCDLYNIDRDNIHVLCKSQGGQLAYYYASNPPAFPIRSISMFAPVLDYFSMDGLHTSADSRRVLAREMGFDGNVESDYVGKRSYSDECKAFFELNIEKFNGMNEAWTGLVGQTLAEKYAAAIDNGEKWWANNSRTDIYQDLDLAKIAFIPVKIWAAVNDNQTPYLKCVEAVAQLNNGGTEAHMRTFQTGGHAINTSTGDQTENVTAANGTVWNSVPTCLVEAVAWMRLKMP